MRADRGNPCGRFRPTSAPPTPRSPPPAGAASDGGPAAPVVAGGGHRPDHPPTLLVQGEQDTLFGLDQADANARQIAAAGGTVKVVWYTGGHDGGAPGPDAARADRRLVRPLPAPDQGADPGTGLRATPCRARCGYRAAPSVAHGVDGARLPGPRTAAPGPSPPVRAPGWSGRSRSQPAGRQPRPRSAAARARRGRSAARRRLASPRSAIDLPGQSARVPHSRPLTPQLLIAGVEHGATCAVARGAGRSRAAGRRGAVREALRRRPPTARGPARLRGLAAPDPVLPADGRPVEVTVTLPGIVAPIEAGNRRIEVVGGHHRPGVRRRRARRPRTGSAIAPADARGRRRRSCRAPAADTGAADGRRWCGIAVVLGICVLAGIWGRAAAGAGRSTSDAVAGRRRRCVIREPVEGLPRRRRPRSTTCRSGSSAAGARAARARTAPARRRRCGC